MRAPILLSLVALVLLPVSSIPTTRRGPPARSPRSLNRDLYRSPFTRWSRIRAVRVATRSDAFFAR